MEAWLFPGQGSQHKGMGAEVLEAFPAELALADRVLGYSVAEACQQDAAGRLRQTQFLQPVLFVVDALTYLSYARTQPEPQYLAGHSLGELVALWAAGCWDFETALRVVSVRGELMGRAAGGGMAAVVGLTADRVAALVAGSGVDGVDGVDLANDNSPTQVVLSGSREAVAALAGPVRQAGARYLPLNVSAAFHSRYMQPAADAFGEVLAGIQFAPPRLPVIANVTARPYPADGVADLLVRQIRSPVRWRESMQVLVESGVRTIREVGPGSVLSGLWRACRAAPPQAAPVPPPVPPAPPAPPEPAPGHDPAAARLGCPEFRRDYGIRYAYLAGSMFRGVASTDLVVRLGRAGLMGFFGAGGLPLPEVERAIVTIRSALDRRANVGMNLLYQLDDPALEQATVELYLRHDVRFVEAAAYPQITAPLVRYRFSGAYRDSAGRPVVTRHVLAKASRPEVAGAFLSPPPAPIVNQLERDGSLSPVEASVARELPVSEDVCVEADSGGHTDGGVSLTLVPAIARLRDELCARYGYQRRARVGASGGLGSPEAVAAAFVLGADFVVTGSVNQCTPQAGTSALVKDLLAGLDVQDTGYAPAGDMFELGAKVQVVRKGTLFAARANKLYQLYRQHPSLAAIDPRTRATLEQSYFGRSLEQVWQETREHHLAAGHPEEVGKAEANPKHKLALVFRWYFAHTTLAALAGQAAEKVNFQIHCGPAMGAFNRFVAGTPLADWRNRDVDVIAERLMSGAARVLAGTRLLPDPAAPSPAAELVAVSGSTSSP